MTLFKMANFVEMDERVGIFEQMEEDVGPVILINKFSVVPEEFDQFLKGWASEAEKFKEQPGFISTRLHKGIGGSGTFVNYAVWQSAAQFKAAVNNVMNPQDRLSAYPPSTVASPHLFKKVAVPGICVGYSSYEFVRGCKSR
jgi:quinol monooxygenase YgiN